LQPDRFGYRLLTENPAPWLMSTLANSFGAKLSITALHSSLVTIRPPDRFKLWMYCDLSEERHVLQWLEHGTPKLSAQIDGSRHSVLEAAPKLVSVQGRYLDHFWNHDLLQRFDPVQRLPCLGACPVFQQFRWMKRTQPLTDAA
jgi:hypothetical protein